MDGAEKVCKCVPDIIKNVCQSGEMSFLEIETNFKKGNNRFLISHQPNSLQIDWAVKSSTGIPDQLEYCYTG